ncbi:thiamine-phosphate kinase [Montanilutibacter psychrotolerans]|uniref:Thiamine-monophosphate kinase n=1 Tax=Montanilutibacter psychrotolerans TaxID=1327343 RepID=A0A3M8T0T0_9GAMM|nr:thiamine-phosphate kinase [Lysobacter psychrotolerans]RNF84302.1 thiamine-phosphate kinase [Lysobacter psychrotolerans]
MPEFDLIDRIRARVLQRDDVVLGIGDDAALLQVPAGRQLVVAMDTLNVGVHFPHATAPADIGWKALAVNLSDLAAMAAEPAWCTLSLSLPGDDPAWVESFLDGFLALAAQHRVALVGGDTTRGPLSISVTVHGFVEPGRALRRATACVDDDIWVSGTLGDAAGALALMSDDAGSACRASPAGVVDASGSVAWTDSDPRDPAHSAYARLRLHLDRPTPRIGIGLALAGTANAAIDISDGLLADLGHVCAASGVGAQLQLDALPASSELRALFPDARRHALQASGGDDYELCFTAPATARHAIEQIAIATHVLCTRIGRIVTGSDVQVLAGDGTSWTPPRAGYVHFGSE